MTRGPFLHFFAHPIVGLVGTAASVLGVGLSFYFYFTARDTPNLTYAVNPTRTAVYRAGQTSSLQVSLGGHLIARDVTATQIAFWNAGHRAIRAANVLLPLRFTFPSTARILEVKLRRTSRPVTGIQIRQVDPRTVEVTWRILERTDGGVLQFIYEGTEDPQLTVAAIVEGQAEITQPTSAGSWKSAEASRRFLSIGVALLLLSGLSLLYSRRFEYYPGPTPLPTPRMVFTFLGAYIFLCGVSLLVVGAISKLGEISEPPFGF